MINKSRCEELYDLSKAYAANELVNLLEFQDGILLAKEIHLLPLDDIP